MRTPPFASMIAVAAALNSANPNGWSMSATALASVTVSRQGFDATGAPVAYPGVVIPVNKYVRKGWPFNAVLSTNTAALADYVRRTDTVTGFANASVMTTPTPICGWLVRDNQVIGNTLRLELYVDHWDVKTQKPVACVIFTATDGNLTVTSLVIGPGVLAGTYDLNAVIGYGVNLDVTTLAPGSITANARVIPWLGDNASIADSSVPTAWTSGVAGTRGFVPLQFTKNVALATTPFYVYIDPVGGNDGTGVANTVAATARAAPCLTFHGGLNKLRATAGNENGGSIVRIMAGTVPITVGPTASSTAMEVTIERDPLVGVGTAIIQCGLNVQTNQKYIRFRNLTIARSGGALGVLLTAGGHVVFENCVYDTNGTTAPITTVSYSLIGGSITNWSGATLVPTAVYRPFLIRGFTAIPVVPTTQGTLDLSFTFGCNLTNCSHSYGSGLLGPASGTCISGNRFIACAGNSPIIGIGSTNALDINCINVSLSNNAFEWVGTQSTTPSLSIGTVGGTNLTHVLITNCTVTSGFDAGRCNIFYDENASGVVRNHSFCKLFATYCGQFNIKEDYFVGNNLGDPQDAPLHTGNYAQLYGVGWGYNFYSYAGAGGVVAPGSFVNEFAGPGTLGPGGATTALRLNPLFTVDGVTTYDGAVYTAGTGGSNLKPLAGSPAKGVVVNPPWGWDITGAVTNNTIGAYNAA